MEINFDGIVGPTHHYGGLSFGNLASMHSAHSVSHPKRAALQGLEKMAFCMRLGIPQAVLPPQGRPNLMLLRQLGFSGNDVALLQQAKKEAPHLFVASYSASSMWAANAATVSPSADSQDGRVHLTVANLMHNLHRAQEANATYKILKKIFADEQYFKVHPPLCSTETLSDEGAANHNRFCMDYHTKGVELFIYGKNGFLNPARVPKQFPARQSLEASRAIARLHGLDPQYTLFAKQNSEMIDKGAFHNDVVSVGNQNVFLYYEKAFENTQDVVKAIRDKMPEPFYAIPVQERELAVQDVISSYLFNSQLLTLRDGSMAILAPQECQELKSAHDILLSILEMDNPLKHLYFVNCRESMKNGGGPACLRLRVVLTEEEEKASHPFIYLTEELYNTLVQWVNQYYREELKEKDLLDPLLLNESREALDKLTQILKLGSLYDFQS